MKVCAMLWCQAFEASAEKLALSLQTQCMHRGLLQVRYSLRQNAVL